MERMKIRTRADVRAVEKVPIEDRLQATNTYDMLRNGAAINPDGPALSFFLSGEGYSQSQTISYRDLFTRITQAANLFHDLGIGPKDVVTYLLPNLPHTHFVLWGAEAAGIVNPINPLLEPHIVRDLCLAANTRVLVALGDLPGADIWPKVVSIRKELPNLRAILRVAGPTEEKEGIYSFDETLAKYQGDRLDSKRAISPEDVASMYHTGGTTGMPKLAARTHLNETAMAFQMGLVAEFHTGETALCGLPLFHANGTTVTGSFPFSIGAHVVLLSPRGYRDPGVIKNFWRIVEHYRAVTFSAVPTVLSALMEVDKEGADVSSLRFVICGAAPLSVELFRRFETYTGLKILEGYGLTEGTCGSSFNPFHGERRIGSIGLRLPYQEMKVLTVDDAGEWVREAGVDEIGIVAVKGPNVFAGYLDPRHNKGIWPRPGWLNTGDLGRQDADGYFWLTGRKKDLIIRGGHNIDPAVIENAVYELSGVSMAAAVARPDGYAGEVPAVYVQLLEGASLSPEQILAHLSERIGERAAIPKEVVLIDPMPLTPVGKIFKPQLRWDQVRRVFSQELEALGDMVESLEVLVGEDKLYGTLATLRIKPAQGAAHAKIEAKAADILGRHTVRYQVEFF